MFRHFSAIRLSPFCSLCVPPFLDCRAILTSPVIPHYILSSKKCFSSRIPHVILTSLNSITVLPCSYFFFLQKTIPSPPNVVLSIHILPPPHIVFCGCQMKYGSESTADGNEDDHSMLIILIHPVKVHLNPATTKSVDGFMFIYLNYRKNANILMP